MQLKLPGRTTIIKWSYHSFNSHSCIRTIVIAQSYQPHLAMVLRKSKPQSDTYMPLSKHSPASHTTVVPQPYHSYCGLKSQANHSGNTFALQLHRSHIVITVTLSYHMQTTVEQQPYRSHHSQWNHSPIGQIAMTLTLIIKSFNIFLGNSQQSMRLEYHCI